MNTRANRMGQRMRSRRQDIEKGASEQTLTSDDIENLGHYARRLDEAIEILGKEVRAIGRGQFDAVKELYEEKAEVLKWLELRAPVVEPFMAHSAARSAGIPDKLSTFQAVLVEDSELLSRIAKAAATIVREVEKVLNRNSLDGIYGSSGEKISQNGKREMTLDQEI